MPVTRLLSTSIAEPCQEMHAGRYRSLMVAVEAALEGKSVSVTGLGRAVAGEVAEKYRIKRMNYLVGNVHLVREAPMVYGAMARWLVAGQRQPVILVDWSTLTSDGSLHILRAAIPGGGRSLTLYEEIHEQANYGNPEVQRRFLEHLAQLLPEGCQPIIITDAGFKNPWFEAVSQLGWYWVGRIRGNVQLSRDGEGHWLTCARLGSLLETNKAEYLGSFILAKSNPLAAHIYGLRKPPKGRVHKTCRGERAQSSASRHSAAGEREPWLLVTNIEGGASIIKQIITAYRKRMQIELGFRDSKSAYFGLGMENARSRSAFRYTVLALVNALAIFSAWLVGKVAQNCGQHRRYQANTARNRSVLSCVFLGLRVLKRRDVPPLTPEALQAVQFGLAEAMAFRE